CGGNELGDLLPLRANEAAPSAESLIAAHALWALDDPCPGCDRLLIAPCLAPQLEETRAHDGMLETRGAVDVPGVACPARTAPRLVVRNLRARARIVGLLSFPGNEAAFDVDLPAAGARAVDAVCRANDLVVVPAVAVALLPAATLARDHAPAARELLH